MTATEIIRKTGIEITIPEIRQRAAEAQAKAVIDDDLLPLLNANENILRSSVKNYGEIISLF
ncbi:MAG: hypothetical protein KBT31_04995 [Firmicutes bacterium]|nr:hypothetical protein [Candidatus Colimorpha enterica]